LDFNQFADRDVFFRLLPQTAPPVLNIQITGQKHLENRPGYERFLEEKDVMATVHPALLQPIGHLLQVGCGAPESDLPVRSPLPAAPAT
jgi:hypothetical protein